MDIIEYIVIYGVLVQMGLCMCVCVCVCVCVRAILVCSVWRGVIWLLEKWIGFYV